MSRKWLFLGLQWLFSLYGGAEIGFAIGDAVQHNWGWMVFAIVAAALYLFWLVPSMDRYARESESLEGRINYDPDKTPVRTTAWPKDAN